MTRRRRPRCNDPADGKQQQQGGTRIAIVGAGLTGLSTAISLERAAAGRVTVFERDNNDCLQPSRSSQGYGLTLTYQPGGILQQLGVLDPVAAADCPSRSHYLLEAKTGRIRGYFGNDFVVDNDSSRGWGQRGNLRVPRQRVRQILLEQLLPTTEIRWGHRLTGMEECARFGDSDDNDDNNNNNNGAGGGGVRLHFANGAPSFVADVVIAADGIRSAVVQLWLPDAPPPRSLRVRLILGITTAAAKEEDDDDTAKKQQHPRFHPLLQERGFYTLDTGMRLFVMPYTGSALGRSLDPDEPVRFMWQLSFAVSDEHDEHDGSSNSNNLTPQELQAEALRRTAGWHEPVQSLIRSTAAADVWGTLLRDRDPVALQRHLLARSGAHGDCVIVAGDALHAMSPFKGQGANRCLHDGAIIAKCLSSASSPSGRSAAVRRAVREMVQRTAPTVAASRTAAQFWHSPQALTVAHKFAGVKDNDVDRLLHELEVQGIGADAKGLDDQIRAVMNDLGLLVQQRQHNGASNGGTDNQTEKETKDTTGAPLLVQNNEDDGEDSKSSSFAAQAFRAVSIGALGELRQLSWQQQAKGLSIRRVADPSTGSTCLHAAAATGCAATVHWLVTQAGCDCKAQNLSGQTPLDVAAAAAAGEKRPDVCEVLQRLQASYEKDR